MKAKILLSIAVFWAWIVVPGSYSTCVAQTLGSSERKLPDSFGRGEKGNVETAVPADGGQRLQVQDGYGQLPLYFIENRGQKEARIRFYAENARQAVYFLKDSIYVSSHGSMPERQSPCAEKPRYDSLEEPVTRKMVRLKPVGMSKQAKIVPCGPLPGRINYYAGNNPSKWFMGVPTYGAVLYRRVYPGIDVKFYGSGSQLEYDIIIRSGADPSRVRFQYEGARNLEVTTEGDLQITLADGVVIRQKKPFIYQTIKGRRVLVEGKFQLFDDSGSAYGFQVASYNRRHSLYIDPVLLYSTYFTGDACTHARKIAVDSAGQAYVTGKTCFDGFPLKDPADPTRNGYDAFVTKINAAGNSLVYSTYLGGTGFEIANDIAVDGSGNAYVAGETYSVDFPTKAPMFTKRGNVEDLDSFLTKLSPDGAMVYSTYLGGIYYDSAAGIAVDSAGNAYIGGNTCSPDFPLEKPISGHENLSGICDLFVTKINPSGTGLIYSTYLGGIENWSQNEFAGGIAVDSAGNAYICGKTNSPNFPTRNPIRSYKGENDAIVAKINSTGSGLVYSTYLGGNKNDNASAIAVDRKGNAYVTGFTASSNFPIMKPLYPNLNGGIAPDAFVTKFSPGGSLIYSTYLGGTHGESAHGIAVDYSGCIYIIGATISTDFPLKNSMQEFRGSSDAFITKISEGGDSLAYSTLLGGERGEEGNGIAVDRQGFVYVTGSTWSNDFPLSPKEPPLYGKFQSTSEAGFISKIGLAGRVEMDTIIYLLLSDN
ncbi:MAG: SBBP repeat-containing protein [Syntrophobacteraceae bacterium]